MMEPSSLEPKTDELMLQLAGPILQLFFGASRRDSRACLLRCLSHSPRSSCRGFSSTSTLSFQPHSIASLRQSMRLARQFALSLRTILSGSMSSSTSTSNATPSPSPQLPVVAIIGTTGVGKSNLAIELAKHLQLRAEVINADSMQIYRGLDVITNKVTEEETQGVKHRLIGVVDPRGEKGWGMQRWVEVTLDEVRRLSPALLQRLATGSFTLTIGWFLCRSPNSTRPPPFPSSPEGLPTGSSIFSFHSASPRAPPPSKPSPQRPAPPSTSCPPPRLKASSLLYPNLSRPPRTLSSAHCHISLSPPRRSLPSRYGSSSVR